MPAQVIDVVLYRNPNNQPVPLIIGTHRWDIKPGEAAAVPKDLAYVVERRGMALERVGESTEIVRAVDANAPRLVWFRNTGDQTVRAQFGKETFVWRPAESLGIPEQYAYVVERRGMVALQETAPPRADDGAALRVLPISEQVPDAANDEQKDLPAVNATSFAPDLVGALPRLPKTAEDDFAASAVAATPVATDEDVTASAARLLDETIPDAPRRRNRQ